MELSEWADWAAILSTLFAGAATIFAGYQVYQSRQERKQDLRFMYAQRAVKLSDMLQIHYQQINEVDEQLQYRQTSILHLDIAQSLPSRELLHEIKICESLSKAAGVESELARLMDFIDMLNWIKIERHAQLSRFKAPWYEASRADSMVWLEAHNKRQEIKAIINEEYVFSSLVASLKNSVLNAYQIKH